MDSATLSHACPHEHACAIPEHASTRHGPASNVGSRDSPLLYIGHFNVQVRLVAYHSPYSPSANQSTFLLA